MGPTNLSHLSFFIKYFGLHYYFNILDREKKNKGMIKKKWRWQFQMGRHFKWQLKMMTMVFLELWKKELMAFSF